MRAAVLGCPHQGTCLPGYFRVNAEAQCSRSILIFEEKRLLFCLM